MKVPNFCSTVSVLVGAVVKSWGFGFVIHDLEFFFCHLPNLANHIVSLYLKNSFSLYKKKAD